MASKLRLIVLGAPGSGKGTISKRIVNEFRLTHLSSGDVLRNNIQNKTEIGQQAKEYVSQGKLLPDNFITKIIHQELNKLAFSSWLLDGFPRTQAQCKSLDALNLNIDRVINLNVPFEVIINRLKHRWVHPPSGRVYNNEFNPPKVPRKDDVTGEPLIQRPDDSEEVVLRRLNQYQNESKPVIDYYGSKGLLHTFTGETSDYLWPLIKENLNQYVRSRSSLSELDTNVVNNEPVTHTYQQYAIGDYRRARFENVDGKIVNEKHAIDLVHQEPVVVANQRVVWSSGGGPLGHPRIYINLDRNEVHDCGYSGRRFIQKKFYDPAKHGKSVGYEEYAAELERMEYNL